MEQFRKTPHKILKSTWLDKHGPPPLKNVSKWFRECKANQSKTFKLDLQFFKFFLRLQKFIAVLQVEVAKSNISNSDANCAEERKKER